MFRFNYYVKLFYMGLNSIIVHFIQIFVIYGIGSIGSDSLGSCKDNKRVIYIQVCNERQEFYKQI